MILLSEIVWFNHDVGYCHDMFTCMLSFDTDYIGWKLIEKSIISRPAKDTALGSMIELTMGFYGHHKRKKQ